MKSEKEKMLAGEPYYASDAELTAMRNKTLKLTMQFNTTGDATVLKELFESEYEGLAILPPFYCEYGSNIHFGKNVFVNFNCSFLSAGPISIGDDCFLGPNVQLYTAIHPMDPEERKTKVGSTKPIRIGSNCWFGGGVIVLPGVTIGDNVVIGAGSVVTKDIPSGSVAYGNPCRIKE